VATRIHLKTRNFDVDTGILRGITLASSLVTSGLPLVGITTRNTHRTKSYWTGRRIELKFSKRVREESVETRKTPFGGSLTNEQELKPMTDSK
jgi:hypothetical protein